MILVQILLLFSLFLLSNLTLANSTRIVFFPNPSQPELITTLAKLAEILITTDNYSCTMIIHDIYIDYLSHVNCTKLIFTIPNKEIFLKNLNKAEDRFNSKSIDSLRALNESYNLYIDAIYTQSFQNELRQLQSEAIVCDASNYLCNVIASKLNASKIISYWSTIINPYWVDSLEMSTSSYPMPNSPFTNQMTLLQRIKNTINYYTLLLTNKYQKRLIDQYLYPKEKNEGFLDYKPLTLFITQDPQGLTYPLNVPPNIASVGCFTCLWPNPLPPVVQKFLTKRRRNILVKFDRAVGFEETNIIIETLSKFPEIGFLIKGNIAGDVETPMNVFKTENVNTVDLLANRKVVALIHDGDFNSIIEGVYFRRPMVILPDHYARANGVLISERMLGLAMNEEEKFTITTFKKAIESFLANLANYEGNLKRDSNIIRNINSTFEVKKWFNYYMENDISTLVVKPHDSLNSFEYNNIDIILFSSLITIFGFYQVWNFFQWILKTNKKPKEK